MQTPAAYHDLLAALGELDVRWREPGVLDDEQSILEGYKWTLALLAVANSVFICADTSRPRFTDIVGPYQKFNGDNVDAFYQYYCSRRNNLSVFLSQMNRKAKTLNMFNSWL